MKQTDPQLKLRLPPALKSAIEQSAEQAGRTLNAEIVLRLQQSYDSSTSLSHVHQLGLKDHLIRDQMGRAHHLRVALLWLAQGVMHLTKLRSPDELPDRARALAVAARMYADDYSASATAAHPAMTDDLLAAQREFIAIEKKRAEVDQLIKTLPLADAVNVEVPGLFPPDAGPMPSADSGISDRTTPKLKRMTMRRNLKE